MEKEQRHYTEEDIEKAFDMGLETAVFVIEKSMGLPIEDQRLMCESIKRKIEEGKINSITRKLRSETVHRV